MNLWVSSKLDVQKCIGKLRAQKNGQNVSVSPHVFHKECDLLCETKKDRAFESLRAHQRKRHVSRSVDCSLSPRVMPRRSLIQTRHSETLVQLTAKK